MEKNDLATTKGMNKGIWIFLNIFKLIEVHVRVLKSDCFYSVLSFPCIL